MNWFEKHLNWTWVFGLIGTYLFQILVGVFYGFFNYSAVNNWTQNDIDNFSFWVWLLAFLLIFIPVTAWVLNKKGRSLGWLLLSGFFFLPLWIDNKRQSKVSNVISGESNYCSNCGASLAPGMVFCSKCGKQLR